MNLKLGDLIFNSKCLVLFLFLLSGPSFAATQCVILIEPAKCTRLGTQIVELLNSAKSLPTEDECFARLAGLKARCQIKLPVSAKFFVDGKVVSENFAVRTNYGRLTAAVRNFLLKD